jgi:putative ABC transport system ATP-binding protein
MDLDLSRFVWRNSRARQLFLMLCAVLSWPLAYASYGLVKLIVDDSLLRGAFPPGVTTAAALKLAVVLPPPLDRDWTLFDGIAQGPLGYLLVLVGALLVLVLGVALLRFILLAGKAATGERLLTRLRLSLADRLLRLAPDLAAGPQAAEAALAIKTETEALAPALRDAFALPLLLGGQAAVALLFIVLHSAWLGLLAAAAVAAQLIVVPRLREREARLERRAQKTARRLGARLLRLAQRLPLVQAHGTGARERTEWASQVTDVSADARRLARCQAGRDGLADLLQRVVPVLFLGVGGVAVLNASLSLGGLIAALMAFRDLPRAVRSLVEWDAGRPAATARYADLLRRFGQDRLLPAPPARLPDPPGEDQLVFSRAALRDGRGQTVLDGIDLVVPLPSHVALLGPRDGVASALARVLGRRSRLSGGQVRFGARDLADLSPEDTGRWLVYAGSESGLIEATLRDNVLYGVATPVGDDEVIAALDAAGLDEDVYRFGLAGRIDPATDTALAERVVAARRHVRRALDAAGLSGAIEPLDPLRYLQNASIGENILFGRPVGDTFGIANLIGNPFVRATLEAEGLTEPLVEIGYRFAGLLVEIFVGIRPGDPLFARLSAISPDEMPRYRDLVARWRRARPGAEAVVDRERLLQLAIAYVEPRHRLDLMTPELQDKLLRARATFNRLLPASLRPAVAFYDTDRVCPAASLQDNLLFGHLVADVPQAEERVGAVLRQTIARAGWARDIYRIGLDQEVGPETGLLNARQSAAVAIARCLVKKPAILVLDHALAAWPERDRRAVMDRIRQHQAGRSLIAVVETPEEATGFANLSTIEGGRLEALDVDAARPRAAAYGS